MKRTLTVCLLGLLAALLPAESLQQRMTRQGLVEGRFVRRATGRPPLVYRLTPKGELAAPETYAAFLRALFAGMHVEGRERIEGLFQQVADQLATAHPEIRNITNVGARIEAARRLFFSEVDSTETKVTENGFQFSIHTCPLAPLSMEFGDLCCVTRRAISKLVGRDVEQSEWIIRGDPRCTFEVRTAAGARRSSANIRGISSTSWIRAMPRSTSTNGRWPVLARKRW